MGRFRQGDGNDPYSNPGTGFFLRGHETLSAFRYVCDILDNVWWSPHAMTMRMRPIDCRFWHKESGREKGKYETGGFEAEKIGIEGGERKAGLDGEGGVIVGVRPCGLTFMVNFAKHSGMPRRARMEYEGAVYHVMDRGNRLEVIFLDDQDREMFLKTLGEGCARAGFRIHSYVLMDNHYHLLLETPEANLSRGMQWIQSTYTIRHNTRHRKRGHLFQGRYKAIVVDPESQTYFRTVSDYIHLNPVRAGILKEDASLVEYAWSSFPKIAGVPGKRPAWLCTGWVLNRGDTVRDRKQYRASLEDRAADVKVGSGTDEAALKSLRRGWFFGSETFAENLLARFKSGCDGSDGAGKSRLHDEHEAERILKLGLTCLELRASDLKSLLKGSAEKVAIASVIKKRTVMTNAWIARKLQMGDPSRVSRYCSEAVGRKEIRKLIARLEMSISKA